MMAFSIEEQLSSDMDIFLKLPYPYKGIHIASGGGIMPEVLMEFDNIINKNAEAFFQMPRQYDFEINPNLANIVEFKSAYHRELYVEDFADKAQRGFWSFDKTNLSDPYDKAYHIVAYPRFRRQNLKDFLPINLLETPLDAKILQNIRVNNNRFQPINLFD